MAPYTGHAIPYSYSYSLFLSPNALSLVPYPIPQTMTPPNTNSLFHQLGGMQTVDIAVNVFYSHVMNDARISHFFRWVDMENQSYKMKTFLAYALGAPLNLCVKSLKESHSHLVKAGLSDAHFDAVLENLVYTLREMGIAEDLIEQVEKVAEGTREEILR